MKEAWGELAAYHAPTLVEHVTRAEAQCLQLPQVNCPVIHSFGPGLYFREIHMPADTFAIGHHQNFEHMNIFLEGRVTILKEDGTTAELKAPMMFVGKPGRKVGYAHEDVVWINVYATEETDVEKLEAHFLTKSEEYFAYTAVAENYEHFKRELDRKDFRLACDELGVTPELVRSQSIETQDMMELPLGSYRFKIGNSGIEGKGIFATADLTVGTVIGPARLAGKRTVLGRFTNHGMKPNAKMIRAGDDIMLTAIRSIKGCQGGQDGEEITIDYRESVRLTREIGGQSCQV